MLPFVRQGRQHRGHRLAQIDLRQCAAHRALEPALNLPVLHHLQSTSGHASQLLPEQLGIARLQQPLRHVLCQVVLAHQRNQGRCIQKLVAHKVRQVLANAVFVAFNDGSVPPHQWQRNPPEQRRHCKPIGQRAHHGGLGHRFDAAHAPRGRQKMGRHKHHRYRDEQQAGPALGTA